MYLSIQAKKQSFSKSKECNLLWEQVENSKNGHKPMTEKEATKVYNVYSHSHRHTHRLAIYGVYALQLCCRMKPFMPSRK